MDLPQSKEKYQVYFLSCPASIPLHFAQHPWVVCVSPQGAHRWEVFHHTKGSQRYGHVHRDYYPGMTQGLKKSAFSKKTWASKLLGSVTGDEESLAHQMCMFIQQESPRYTYKDIYRFSGPNSNTYIAWILKNFPEAEIALPENAFGKNY